MKIDSNVPAPRRALAYAVMDSMRPGDSFFTREERHPQRFHVEASRRGIRITYRREGNGYRVWRIG